MTLHQECAGSDGVFAALGAMPSEDRMARGNYLDGLKNWLMREVDREVFDDVLAEHLEPACENAGVKLEDLPKIIGPEHCRPLWGCAFNDLMSRELEDGSNLAEDYLKRRGWKEPVSTRRYLAALRNSVMSIYEVSEVVPGASFLARDLVRSGEPVPVTERTATRILKQGDRIAARIMQVGQRFEMAGGVLPLSQGVSEYALQQIHRMADEARQQTNTADACTGTSLDNDTATYAAVLRRAAAPISSLWLSALLRTLREPDGKSATLTAS